MIFAKDLGERKKRTSRSSGRSDTAGEEAPLEGLKNARKGRTGQGLVTEKETLHGEYRKVETSYASIREKVQK